MAYSTQRAVSDGTLVLLNVSLDYFDRTEINVLIGGIVSPSTSGKWNWVGSTNKQIAFTPAIANGVEVTIKRTTQFGAPLNQYTKGAQFIAETLDENFNQVLRIAQEASEGAGARDVFNDVDYHGFKITNVGPAVNPTDVVTLAQYQSDTLGANASKVAAAASAAAALASQNAAAGSATAAGTSATNAATSEANALGSKNAAATSATNAGTSETNALASKNAAAATLVSFKNLYYGAASSAPTTRPDASAMVVGDLYFDSTLNQMRVRQASSWVSLPVALTGSSAQDFAAQTLTASVGVVTPSLNGGPLAGYRNKIINGNMRINQRVVTAVAANNYGPDRWLVACGNGQTYAFGGVFNDGSLSRSGTTHLGLICGTAKTTLAANDYAMLSYSIEGYDMADLKWGTAQAKPITISFWASPSVAGTYCLSVRGASYSRTYVVPLVMAVGSAYYSVTVPGDTTGPWETNQNVGINLSLSLACGTQFGGATANTWGNGAHLATPAQSNGLAAVNTSLSVTDVQLERGTVATPFEFRPFGVELLLCQRYYCKTQPYAVAPTQGTGNTAGALFFSPAAYNAYHGVRWELPVAMRTSPTYTAYTVYSGSSNSWTNPSGTVSSPAGLIAGGGDKGVFIAYNGASSATPSSGDALYIHMTAFAEI